MWIKQLLNRLKLANLRSQEQELFTRNCNHIGIVLGFQRETMFFSFIDLKINMQANSSENFHMMQQWNQKKKKKINGNKGYVKRSWWSRHLYKYILQYSSLESHIFQTKNADSTYNTLLEGSLKQQEYSPFPGGRGVCRSKYNYWETEDHLISA